MPPRRILPGERSPSVVVPGWPVPVAPRVPLMVRAAAGYVGLLGVGAAFGAVFCALAVVTGPDVPVWSFGDDGPGALVAAVGVVLCVGAAVLAALASTGLTLGLRNGWLTAAGLAVAELALATASAIADGGWTHVGPGIVLLVLLLWPSVVRHTWRGPAPERQEKPAADAS